MKSLYKIVSESFDNSIVVPEKDSTKNIPVEKVNAAIKDASDNYEAPPSEFVEYKYKDKLNDIRQDIDYFKTRMDESESQEAKNKYMKIINDLLDEEKCLIGVTSVEEKRDIDKANYVAKKVACQLSK